MILYLNTQDAKTATIGLFGPRATISKTWNAQFDLSETFLSTIKAVIKKGNIKLSDLTAIAVVIGPGLFSRLRTAVVVANALAFVLQIKIIPLSGKESINYQTFRKRPRYTQVLPKYGKAPNITRQKNRG